MGARKRKKQQEVGDVLTRVIRHQGWDVKFDLHSFFPKWKEVAGESVASCSRPVKIVKNVLWIEVDNSTWMQQLQFEKRRLLDDINSSLKKSRLRDIKFILPQDDETAGEGKEQKISFVSPDPEMLEKFEQQAKIIEDAPSRDALVRFWYLNKACRRPK